MEVGRVVSMRAGKAKHVRARAAVAGGAGTLLAMLIGLANPASGSGVAASGLLGGDEASAGPDVAAATGAAQTRLGDRYGGAWIDRSSGSPVLKVGVAGSGDPAAPGSGPLAAPGVELVGVDRSLAELERAGDEALDALPQESSSPIAIDADPSRGAVIVSGGNLDHGAQARIRRAAGAPVLFDGEDELGVELVRAACSFCYPPWRAALPIRTGKALCTGAFTVYQGKRRKHKYRALSAGHCQTGQRKVYVARRKVGKITANSFRHKRRVAADALRFKIPRKHRRAQLATARYGDLPVTGKLLNRALVRGQFVCFIGRTTGGGCGFIGRSDIAVRLGRKTFTHLWCAGVPTRAGDSGAPVAQPRGRGVRAAGVVNLSLQTPTSDEMCFSSISLVERKLGVRLLRPSSKRR